MLLSCLCGGSISLFTAKTNKPTKQFHRKILRQFDQIYIKSHDMMTNNGEVVSKNTFHHTCLYRPIFIYTILIHDTISIVHLFFILFYNILFLFYFIVMSSCTEYVSYFYFYLSFLSFYLPIKRS